TIQCRPASGRTVRTSSQHFRVASSTAGTKRCISVSRSHVVVLLGIRLKPAAAQSAVFLRCVSHHDVGSWILLSLNATKIGNQWPSILSSPTTCFEPLCRFSYV